MKQLISVLVIAISLSACYKPYHAHQPLDCPPYDPTLINAWFPYEKGKTYNYKDDAGNKHWLTIDNVSYIDGDEQGGCVIPTQCIPSGAVFASRDMNKYEKIWLNAVHYINTDGEQLDLQWNSINVHMLVNTDGTLSLNPIYYNRPEDYYKEIKPDFTHHAKLALNEVDYTDVYEIVFNKNDMGNAHKLYLVKGQGIVGYQAQNGTDYWKE